MSKPPTLVPVDVVGVTMAKKGLIVVSVSHGHHEFSEIQTVFSVYQVNSYVKTFSFYKAQRTIKKLFIFQNSTFGCCGHVDDSSC